MTNMITKARWGFHGFTSNLRWLLLPTPWEVAIEGTKWTASDGVQDVLAGDAPSPRTAMKQARRAALELAERAA